MLHQMSFCVVVVVVVVALSAGADFVRITNLLLIAIFAIFSFV